MSDYSKESLKHPNQQYHNGANGYPPYDPEGHRKPKSRKSMAFMICAIVALLLAVILACIVLAVVLKESKDDNEYTVNVNLHLPQEFKEEYTDPDSPERKELEDTLCAEAGKATDGMGMDSCKLGTVEPGSIRVEITFVFIVTIEIRQQIVEAAEDCEDCGVEATTVSFDILIAVMMPRIIIENAPEGGLLESGVVCETLSCEGAPELPESSGSGSEPGEEVSGNGSQESSGGSDGGDVDQGSGNSTEVPNSEASGEGSGEKSDNKSESESESESESDESDSGSKSKPKCKSAKSKSEKKSKEGKDGHPVFGCEPNPGGQVHPGCEEGNDDGGDGAEDEDCEED